MRKLFLCCMMMFLCETGLVFASEADPLLQKYLTHRADIIPMPEKNLDTMTNNPNANPNASDSIQSNTQQSTQPYKSLREKSIWNRIQTPIQKPENKVEDKNTDDTSSSDKQQRYNIYR